MATYSEHDVTANGINIHYYRSTPPGGGPAVVMIHGITDNGMCWVRVADALSGAYDVILPDTRGHGRSDRPETGYTVEDRAADVAGLIDALGLRRPALIGHSLGGQTATVIAARYPERVGALVLEDPAWFSDEKQEERGIEADGWCTGLRADQQLGRDGLIAKCRQEAPTWHEEERGPWADSKLEMSEHALREILISMRPGWQAYLQQIQCPILLVTGDLAGGIIITPDLVQEAAALNPRIQEAHIEAAGHSIHREQFDAYMEQVKNFLLKTIG